MIERVRHPHCLTAGPRGNILNDVKKERPFWENVEAYPLWRLMSYVFLFALSERLIVTLVFFFRWGFHTVSGIELWFYYGVAGGTFDLYSVWDPSWWLLKALGLLFRGEALLYSVHCLASLSSSLNAALFCLLVSKLHNKKTGFMAGLIYGSMVLPMFNSAATVTHDIFAYPYLILSLLGAVMFVKSEGPAKLLYAALCLLSLFIGIHVGPAILVGAAAIFIYLVWLCVRALAGQKARDGHVLFGIFLAAVIGVAVLVHFLAMPALMQKMFDLAKETRGVDVRAQIKVGAGDLLATSPGDYWLRLNYLLFFLPAGLYVAFRKRDMLGWGLVIAGVLASCAADRGTRPLSFGVALMGALAFVNWRVSYNWVMAACMGFAVGYFGGYYSLEYAVVFPAAALLIYAFIQWACPGEKGKGSRTLFFLGLLWLIGGCVAEGWIRKAPGGGAVESMRWIRNIWSVQTCLLVPVALVLLDAWMRRPADRNERRWINSALGKYACALLAAAAILLLAVKPAGIWAHLYLVIPSFAAVAVFILVRPRRREESRKHLAGVAAVCWLFAIAISSVNLPHRTTEGQYRVYKWLKDNEPPAGKIFVPWANGYMAEAVSGHPSEMSPQKIDFQLPRVFWMTEEEAARRLAERGVRYLAISTNYLRITGRDGETGDFKWSCSSEIGYGPQDAGVTEFAQLERTALFKLLYRPRRLSRFRLLRVEVDPAVNTTYFLYKL